MRFAEDLKLERERAIRGSGDAGLKLGELGRGEAHHIGQRLAVNEQLVVRRLAQACGMVGADLDEIAEHIVVPDLQGLDAGRVGITSLQARDELAAAVAKISLLVEIGAEFLADEAAVALVDGKLVGKGGGEASH